MPKFVKIDAIPEWAVNYMTYGEPGDLTNEEMDLVDSFMDELGLVRIVGLEEEGYFCSHPAFGLATTCYDCSFQTKDIRESFRKKMNEMEELEEEIEEVEEEGPMSFMDFVDILDKNGYVIINEIDGKNFIRFEIDKHGKPKISIEELAEELKAHSKNPEKIVLSIGRHRYAPEIKRASIVFDLR